MKVVEWSADNYKSIDQGTIELSDFTALIGKNNSGKSNIIDSLMNICEYHTTHNLSSGYAETLENIATGKELDRPVKFELEFELENGEYDAVIKMLEDDLDETSPQDPREYPSMR